MKIYIKGLVDRQSIEVIAKKTKVILYIYHMASRVTYRNVSPEVTRKPWRVMSPDAEVRIN